MTLLVITTWLLSFAASADLDPSVRAHLELLRAQGWRLGPGSAAAAKVGDELERIEREYGLRPLHPRHPPDSVDANHGPYAERFARSYAHAVASAADAGLFLPEDLARDFAELQAELYEKNPVALARWIERYRRVFITLRDALGTGDNESARFDAVRVATRHDTPEAWVDRFARAFDLMHAPFAEGGMQFSRVEAHQWAKEQADNYPVTSHLEHWLGRYRTAFDFARAPVAGRGLGIGDDLAARRRAIEFAQQFVFDDHLAEWINRYRLALDFMTRARADGGLGVPTGEAARWAAELAEADHNREHLRDWIARVSLGIRFARTPILGLGGGLEHDEDGAVGWGLELAKRFWNSSHLSDHLERYSRAVSFARAPRDGHGLGLDDHAAKGWACAMIERYQNRPHLDQWIARYRAAVQFMSAPIEKGGTGLNGAMAAAWATRVADANHEDGPIHAWIEHYRTALAIAWPHVGPDRRFATPWDARTWALHQAGRHGEHRAWRAWLASNPGAALGPVVERSVAARPPPPRPPGRPRPTSRGRRCARFLNALFKR